MTLSSALYSALSGLGATARRAEIVSTNVANAATESFARRSISVAASLHFPGVRIVGTERNVDEVLLGETRISGAEAGGMSYLARQLARLESVISSAGGEAGLPRYIARLDAALVSASAEPGSEAALAEVSDAVAALARGFSIASQTVQDIRAEADRQIASDVERLNSGLARIAALDRQIKSLDVSGRDVSSLQDERQQQIDALTRILPLREVTRQDGQRMIVSLAGTVLLDDRVAKLTFSATPTISADNQDPLASILLDGRSVQMAPDGQLSGGTLSAAFNLRDTVTTSIQSDLDRISLTLATRLADADDTSPPGSPGLLTDDGSASDSARVKGLAARLMLNPLAELNASGALWKVRSGLGATTPLPAGDSSVLRALHSALGAGLSPLVAAQDLSERVTQQRLLIEDQAAAASARNHALRQQFAEGSVNTDQEMQDLMQVERAYAANARVIQTVDEMLKYLLAR